MEIFFENDGSYGQSAVGIPVIADEKPIGFIREVLPDKVVCNIWDRFIGREQVLQNIKTMEQDICSVYINTKG